MKKDFNVRYKKGECPYWVHYLVKARHEYWTWMHWARKNLLQSEVYDLSKTRH